MLLGGLCYGNSVGLDFSPELVPLSFAMGNPHSILDLLGLSLAEEGVWQNNRSLGIMRCDGELSAPLSSHERFPTAPERLDLHKVGQGDARENNKLSLGCATTLGLIFCLKLIFTNS